MREVVVITAARSLFPPSKQDFATSVSNALVEAIEEAKDQPGKITSAVRAYASVVLEAVTNTSEIPAAERGDLKVRM